MTFLTDRFGVTSSDNSTSQALGEGVSYTGTGENVENYGNVSVNVRSDKDSATGGVQLQFSSDNTTWDIIETHTYTASKPLLISTNVKAKYFRISFVNSTGNGIAALDLQTVLTQIKVGGGAPTEVMFNDNNLDAFGRIKVSNPTTLLDITHTKDKNELIVYEDITGGATGIHDPDSSSVLMSVSTNNDEVTRQSRKYTVYQPGKSLFVILTGVIDAGGNGDDTISRMGYFDDQNGFFFQYDGTTLSIVKRQNGTDVETVSQSSWNEDKANGTGNSGITINPARTQIFFFDIEWLGVGTVRAGFFFNGEPIIVHKFHHANIETNTYIKNANLPIRYQLSAVGATNPTGSLRHICSSVISDGGYNPVGKTFSANTGSSTLDADFGTPRPLISIRLKSTGAGAELNTFVNLLQFSAITTNTGGKGTVAELWLTQDTGDSILTTPSPTWVSANDESAVESDITSTVIDTSNSVRIQSLVFSNKIEIFSSALNTIISLTSNKLGVSDILSLVVEPLDSGSNVSYAGTLNWEEIF